MRIIPLAIFILFLISACDAFLPAKGDLGQPCTDGGLCLDGFICVENTCVDSTSLDGDYTEKDKDDSDGDKDTTNDSDTTDKDNDTLDETDKETTDGDVDKDSIETETTDGDTDATTETDKDAIDKDFADGDSEPEKEPETEYEVDYDGDLPTGIPFKLNRDNVGTQPSDQEITDFTKKITGFWKDTDYFKWIWRLSHGHDSSYNNDMMGFKLFWQGVTAYKEGDKVRFVHTDNSDNMMIASSKILSQAISGYLLTGDETMGKITLQYLKGFVAQSLAMEFDGENPVIKYLQARALYTHNHSYTMEGGRKVEVEYDAVKQLKEDWNAHTIPNSNNPEYESIWIRNMRSKDDVGHMYRTVPLMMRLEKEAKDEEIKKAATLALEYMQGFAKDIVDNGYYIRTKNKDGRAVIAKNKDNIILDLASFVQYEGMLPNAECNGKLSSALVAYGELKDNDCKNGISKSYEIVSTSNHYNNYAIIRYFHIASITNALVNSYLDTAKALLLGLIDRVDEMESDYTGRATNSAWNADTASVLLASAASGLPLTSKEVKIIHDQYSVAVDHYKKWKFWDPWTASVSDGTFSYKPYRYETINDDTRITYVDVSELAYLLEYCYSPFKNEEGQKLVDCDIISNPTKWGE